MESRKFIAAGAKSQHRHLPHLSSFLPTPIVFFTLVTYGRRRILDNATAHEALHSVWQRSGEQDGWFVGDYMLMPDHLHVFARPAMEAKPTPPVVKLWKAVSGRKMMETMGVAAPVWQPDYFDRFLRNGESYAEKWAYVELNPVRAKLVERSEQWPYKGRIHDLRF